MLNFKEWFKLELTKAVDQPTLPVDYPKDRVSLYMQSYLMQHYAEKAWNYLEKEQKRAATSKSLKYYEDLCDKCTWSTPCQYCYVTEEVAKLKEKEALEFI